MIIVRAFSAGICMGEVKINAAIGPVETRGIIQTPILSEGRLPVVKNPKQVTETPENIPTILKDIQGGVDFGGQSISSIEKQLDHLLTKNNPTLESKTGEYAALKKSISNGML